MTGDFIDTLSEGRLNRYYRRVLRVAGYDFGSQRKSNTDVKRLVLRFLRSSGIYDSKGKRLVIPFDSIAELELNLSIYGV